MVLVTWRLEECEDLPCSQTIPAFRYVSLQFVDSIDWDWLSAARCNRPGGTSLHPTLPGGPVSCLHPEGGLWGPLCRLPHRSVPGPKYGLVVVAKVRTRTQTWSSGLFDLIYKISGILVVYRTKNLSGAKICKCNTIQEFPISEYLKNYKFHLVFWYRHNIVNSQQC